jgi:hypothetical protein
MAGLREAVSRDAFGHQENYGCDEKVILRGLPVHSPFTPVGLI